MMISKHTLIVAVVLALSATAFSLDTEKTHHHRRSAPSGGGSGGASGGSGAASAPAPKAESKPVAPHKLTSWPESYSAAVQVVNQDKKSGNNQKIVQNFQVDMKWGVDGDQNRGRTAITLDAFTENEVNLRVVSEFTDSKDPKGPRPNKKPLKVHNIYSYKTVQNPSQADQFCFFFKLEHDPYFLAIPPSWTEGAQFDGIETVAIPDVNDPSSICQVRANRWKNLALGMNWPTSLYTVAGEQDPKTCGTCPQCQGAKKIKEESGAAEGSGGSESGASGAGGSGAGGSKMMAMIEKEENTEEVHDIPLRLNINHPDRVYNLTFLQYGALQGVALLEVPKEACVELKLDGSGNAATDGSAPASGGASAAETAPPTALPGAGGPTSLPASASNGAPPTPQGPAAAAPEKAPTGGDNAPKDKGVGLRHHKEKVEEEGDDDEAEDDQEGEENF